MRNSPMPMMLWWGDEPLPRGGNTALSQMLSGPDRALTQQAWMAADWTQMQSDLARVRRTADVLWRENLPVPLPRTPAGEFRGTYSYSPIVDGAQLVGILFMCTRHYRASAVHENGRFGYAAVIHSMDVGFALVEAVETPPDQWLDYRFIDVNEAWNRQTGQDIVPGLRITEMVNRREPFWPQMIERVLRTGLAERAKTRNSTAGRTLDVFAMRLGGSDSRQVALLVRDVSTEAQTLEALRLSEQRARSEAACAEAERKRLDAVLEATPAPVFVVDAQGQFIRANSRAREDWGRHPEGDNRLWIGWWADRSEHHGQRLKAQDWPLVRALQGQTCHDLIDIARPDSAGERKSYVVSAAPIHGLAGSIEGAVVIATEITAQVQAERALQEAHQRKDEFLAMLAHELRNPLAPIGSAAELMSRPQTGKDVMLRTSAIIARQVRHMTALVDDLLDISRVSRGTITLDKEFIDTGTLVSDALEQVAPMLRERQHRLDVHPPAQPLLFEGDRKRVIQVLSNLLNNAIKYTPVGGHIELSVTQVGEQIELRVKDNGQGMDTRTLARAFELFAQAECSSDRQQGGLGIGLALVKKLVELHDGQVWATSEGPGQGSEFVVRLPTSRGAAAAPRAPAREHPRQPRQLQVMVVDDHVDGAMTLSMLIEADGHRCQVAHDPLQALQMLEQQTPQALVLDIGLPGMDGRELARRLRAHAATSGALLIGLSGYAQPQDFQAALDAGFDHYLVKPVDAPHLLGLLAEHSAQLQVSVGTAGHTKAAQT